MTLCFLLFFPPFFLFLLFLYPYLYFFLLSFLPFICLSSWVSLCPVFYLHFLSSYLFLREGPRAGLGEPGTGFLFIYLFIFCVLKLWSESAKEGLAWHSCRGLWIWAWCAAAETRPRLRSRPDGGGLAFLLRGSATRAYEIRLGGLCAVFVCPHRGQGGLCWPHWAPEAGPGLRPSQAIEPGHAGNPA